MSKILLMVIRNDAAAAAPDRKMMMLWPSHTWIVHCKFVIRNLLRGKSTVQLEIGSSVAGNAREAKENSTRSRSTRTPPTPAEKFA